MNIKHRFAIILFLCLWACNTGSVPKPRAMLRLEYPEARYDTFVKAGYYRFEKNEQATISREKEHTLNISYPGMKATVFITYKPVEHNLAYLLEDVQKLTYEHVIKADKITETPFINKMQSVYGMLYEVSGDAASQLQFYVTDSTRHFLTGSLYFHARPNYDSILPAAAYIKKDVRKLMETLEWDN